MLEQCKVMKLDKDGNVIIRSPNNNHCLDLFYRNSAVRGPAHYKISIDGIPIRGSEYSNSILWSPDSRYLAIGEHLRTECLHNTPPVTRMVVFSIPNMSTYISKTLDPGWVYPILFNSDSLLYKEVVNQRYNDDGVLIRQPYKETKCILRIDE